MSDQNIMTKRTLVWIVLTAIGLLAAAGAFWSASGTRKITLTETELQERLGLHLPKEFKGVTVDQANVKLADNRIALRIEAEGSALGAPYAVVASANGAPRYDAARGELFFDADSVRIESVTFRGTPLLGGKIIPTRCVGGSRLPLIPSSRLGSRHFWQSARSIASTTI